MATFETFLGLETDPGFDALRTDLWGRGAHRIYTDLHLENDVYGNPHGHLHELWEENGHQVLIQARVYQLRIDSWQVFRTLVDRQHTDKALSATRHYLNLPQ